MQIDRDLLDLLSNYLFEKLTDDGIKNVNHGELRARLEKLIQEEIQQELIHVVEYLYEKIDCDIALIELKKSITKTWDYYEQKAKLIQIDYAIIMLTGKTRGTDVA